MATRAARRIATAARAGQSSKKKGGAPRSVDVNSQQHKRLIELLRPLARPPPPSEAEQKRLRALMIQFGRLKRRQHLEVELRFNEFRRAKWAAIDALPHARKVEALHTECVPFPINRPIFTHTPPIKGFNSGDMKKRS